MIKYNRYLAVLAPIITLILLEIFFFYPKSIFLVLATGNLFLATIFWLFTRASSIGKDWWNFYILSGIILSSSLIYNIFIDNRAVIQGIIVACAIILLIYLRMVFYYLLQPISYQPYSIENFSSLMNFLCFFLLASSAYGLQSFLGIPIWLLGIGLAIIAAVLSYQIIWANKINYSAAVIYIIVCGFIIFELFWSISWLPLNFNIAGLSLALCYYVIISLVKHYLLDSLDRKKTELYLGLGLAGLIILLITAQWM